VLCVSLTADVVANPRRTLPRISSMPRRRRRRRGLPVRSRSTAQTASVRRRVIVDCRPPSLPPTLLLLLLRALHGLRRRRTSRQDKCQRAPRVCGCFARSSTLTARALACTDRPASLAVGGFSSSTALCCLYAVPTRAFSQQS